jgi:phage portal protein BeeE
MQNEFKFLWMTSVSCVEYYCAFWRQTIIPLAPRTQQGFAGWMSAVHRDIRIEANLDRIDALADEREAEWQRIVAARSYN